MNRRSQDVHGTPIEQAPPWMLAVLTVLLWLVLFPGLVGLLDAAKLLGGSLRSAAVGAAVAAVGLVAGLATRKAWRRPTPGSRVDERPLFVRFSTWLITALAVPNVVHGVMVISRAGKSLDPTGAILLGLIVSTIHGTLALVDRWKRRTRASSGEVTRKD
jgi:hypothetical protein